MSNILQPQRGLKKNKFSGLRIVFYGFLFWLLVEFSLKCLILISPAFHQLVDPSTFRQQKQAFPGVSELTHAEVVVIGDSQVRYENLEQRTTWPYLIGKILEKTSSSVGHTDLGPAQSYRDLSQALMLAPKTILLSLYFGNDFYQAFEKAYSEIDLKQFRLLDEDRLKKIHNLESSESIRKKMEEMQAEISVLNGDSTLEKGVWFQFKSKIISSLVTARILHRLKKKWELRLFPRKQIRIEKETFNRLRPGVINLRGIYEAVDEKGVKEIFRPGYLMHALNREDPRIAEGLRLTFEFILQVQERLKKEGVSLVVLPLPTKDYVFSAILQERKISRSEIYAQLALNEKLIRELLVSFLKTHEILTIDVSKDLQNAIRAGIRVYPVLDDDYLTPAGHLVVAEKVAEILKRFANEDKKSQNRGPFSPRVSLPRDKDFELKCLTGFLGLAFIVCLWGTQRHDIKRPIFFTLLFLGYTIFQTIHMIEFFPLTAFQMFSFPEEKAVFYDKLVILREDGEELKVKDYEILPALHDGRTKDLIRQSMKDPEIANQFAAVLSKAYDERIRRPGEQGIGEIRMETWKWDIFNDPSDPNQGYLLKRVTGKPYVEE